MFSRAAATSRRRCTGSRTSLQAANPQAARTDVGARVVFVGQGVSAPSRGHDDYGAVDVRGAIVALVGGAPADLQSEEHAYFASLRTKLQAAAAHGAVGAVLLTGGATKARPVDERSRLTMASVASTAVMRQMK